VMLYSSFVLNTLKKFSGVATEENMGQHYWSFAFMEQIWLVLSKEFQRTF
jgi:hypothetical protein